ncbi:MAG: hypothetical protein JNM41_07725 [Flavipsychrobacter sp.]|nr:hypothetical protein [Flavipsychrobacter sp.]
MVHIHATQKLLNTSRISAPLHITEATPGQQLHSWYCTLQPTGFAGKMLVTYYHEPSLITVVCRGQTIKGTHEEFRERVANLLQRHGFGAEFIGRETALMAEYVVSKTNSRRMLGYMNEIKLQLEFMCSKSNTYENIATDEMEDLMMNWLYQNPEKRSGYNTALKYWKDQGVL